MDHDFRYTDIQSVVNTIENHPNIELRQYIKIGAVTTCIDPNNTYMFGHTTIPGLLEQCAKGWVNNVVLTGSNYQMVTIKENMLIIQIVMIIYVYAAHNTNGSSKFDSMTEIQIAR